MTPSMNTWKSIIKESDFSLQNLPFGIFSSNRRQPRVGVALGDEIIDLAALHDIGLLGDLEIKKSVLINSSLNDFIGLGRKATTTVRSILQQHLNDPKSELKDYPSLFVQQSNAKMHLPVKIGDYTDFYSSIDHARNVGKLFRDPKNALLPNWRHLPVAYHGRSSSIIVSGEDIIRPKGQLKPDENLSPVFGPTQRLDFELEMGFIIGKDSQMGSSITTAEAEDYIFGLVLVNDWSARDIQKWEYIPLGPFLGKNFATSISPWVIPLESLEPFRTNGPKQAPAVLPYLQYKGKRSFDISLEVAIAAEGGEEEVLCQVNFKSMYWNMSQQLAHHTINGCPVRVGDLMASGTISGKTRKTMGSLLEITQGGNKPIKLSNGTSRAFLQDYDKVIMRGKCAKKELRIGFGEVRGRILPANLF